jgi:hypothetical protein
MTQNTLWQKEQQSADYAELCNALYERELRLLATKEYSSAQTIQSRLKSLPYYINRTAFLMTKVANQNQSPLILDVQNASWSSIQKSKLPLAGQSFDDICRWFTFSKLKVGLVIPVASEHHIVLDSIDRIDHEKLRFRTNVYGWFSLSEQGLLEKQTLASVQLLKPNKTVMLAACAGHCWRSNGKTSPIIPTLRELLLSCAINWRNFKQPLPL